MPNYRLKDGIIVDRFHPEFEKRLVWYASGNCGFWTDDCDITVCPNCGAPGFQIEFDKWLEGAQKYEENGNKEYVTFLMLYKESCFNEGFMTAYRRWKR